MSIDTTNGNNLLNEEEIKQLKQLYNIKKNILSYLDMDLFIKKVTKLIEDSKKFDFRSAVSKLTINKSKPVFVLKVTDKKLLTKLTNIESTDETGMKTLEELSVHLNEDIIKEINIILTEGLKDNDNKIFDGIPDELKSFIISNIFAIRFSLKENNIQLLYFI